MRRWKLSETVKFCNAKHHTKLSTARWWQRERERRKFEKDLPMRKSITLHNIVCYIYFFEYNYSSTKTFALLASHCVTRVFKREIAGDTKCFHFYPQLNLIQKINFLSSYRAYGYGCCVCFLFDSPKWDIFNRNNWWMSEFVIYNWIFSYNLTKISIKIVEKFLCNLQESTITKQFKELTLQVTLFQLWLYLS